MEYTPNPELERLRAEKEKNEKEIEQLTHKITRYKNRQKYYEDGERKAKAKYKAEHEKELKQYYAVRRKLLEVCPDGKHDQKLLDKEYAALEKAHAETYAKFKVIREEHQQIYHIHSCVEKGCRAEQTHQKKDHRKQEER